MASNTDPFAPWNGFDRDNPLNLGTVQIEIIRLHLGTILLVMIGQESMGSTIAITGGEGNRQMCFLES